MKFGGTLHRQRAQEHFIQKRHRPVLEPPRRSRFAVLNAMTIGLAFIAAWFTKP